MAKERTKEEDYVGPLRRLLTGLLILCLAGLFLLWRIDSPRVERMRAQITDAVVPNFEWMLTPLTATVNLFRDFQSYQRVVEQNQELRRELQQMKAWKEAALQLEQENARLMDLNKVRLDPRLTHVTGVVLADSGSPFRQSVLLNVGARDGIVDGWATMDGIGLVGRISGVGENTARVILLTDSASRIPAIIQPSGQRALVPTGLAMAIPAGFEGQVRPRSGLAAKNGITVLNTPGTIDADYRGEVKVILINLGDEDFVIERGMRIAQMVIAPVTQAAFSEVESLSETDRGAGGFGSTGT